MQAIKVRERISICTKSDIVLTENGSMKLYIDADVSDYGTKLYAMKLRVRGGGKFWELLLINAKGQTTYIDHKVKEDRIEDKMLEIAQAIRLYVNGQCED